MAIDSRVDIGHVHLKVADLERALGFYCGILGFELQHRMGDQAAFISAGGYHHHLGLNTWESKGGSPPPPGTTGLFHTAIRYPDRATLADALRRLLAAGHAIDGATDHGVSEATGPRRSGRGTPTARSRCSTRPSTSRRCLRKRPRRLSGKQCRSTDDNSVGGIAVRCL
jgi:catechol-2,3-dioxygenase